MSQRANLFLLCSFLIACGGVADEGAELPPIDEPEPTRETAGLPVDPTVGPTGCAGSTGAGSHSVCTIGTPLRACTPCVATICAADPYCCTQSWDVLCVKAARQQASCRCSTGSAGGSGGSGGSTL